MSGLLYACFSHIRQASMSPPIENTPQARQFPSLRATDLRFTHDLELIVLRVFVWYMIFALSFSSLYVNRES
jgi:hypothetical protein